MQQTLYSGMQCLVSVFLLKNKEVFIFLYFFLNYMSVTIFCSSWEGDYGQIHTDKNRFKKSHSTVPGDGRLFLACKPHVPTCIAAAYRANLTLSRVFKIYEPLGQRSKILHY